jgi:prepilin-type N-terminal cleavage/methylation domain-containing protein
MPNMRRAFTLVELMIVIAIVMVLAAIAIPALNQMQLRSKLAEGPMNARGIYDAMTAYMVATDANYVAFFQTTPVPRDGALLDKKAVSWVTGTNFDPLGWKPDGDVRCNYYFQHADECTQTGAAQTWKESSATCDIDDDENHSFYVCCSGPAGCYYLANSRPGVY